MVVSSLFLKKMVTQTLQSGQRSHHLLFNYERDNFVLKPGQIIVTMTDLSKQADTLGFSAIVPNDEYVWLHNQRIGLLEFKENIKIDPFYVSYLLRTREYRSWVVGSSSGTTVKHTSPKRIEVYECKIPPYSEQRAIACVLGSLDAKIELNRKMNQTLEAMVRALFKSWFVDFKPVLAKAEGRDTGLPKVIADLFPGSFQDSELGEIPKGWKVSSVGEIAEVIDCLHSKKPIRRETGKPLLQLVNIQDDGLIDLRDKYFINEDDYKKWITRMEAMPGDCVITNVGRVGAVAQMAEGQRAALGRNMTGIRCLPVFPYPTELIECLLSDSMRNDIEMKTDSGTILNALNVRNIPKLRFVKAEPQVLKKFEQIARPIRNQMERNKAEMCNLAEMRDAILPGLISGEIQIKDPTKFVGVEMS